MKDDDRQPRKNTTAWHPSVAGHGESSSPAVEPSHHRDLPPASGQPVARDLGREGPQPYTTRRNGVPDTPGQHTIGSKEAGADDAHEPAGTALSACLLYDMAALAERRVHQISAGNARALTRLGLLEAGEHAGWEGACLQHRLTDKARTYLNEMLHSNAAYRFPGVQPTLTRWQAFWLAHVAAGQGALVPARTLNKLRELGLLLPLRGPAARSRAGQPLSAQEVSLSVRGREVLQLLRPGEDLPPDVPAT